MVNKSKKTSNTSVSKLYKDLTPAKMFMALFVGLFAVIGATYVFATSAASPIPRGTLAINASSNLVYGGKVVFDATYSGKVGQKAMVQVSLVCTDSTGATVLQGALNVYDSVLGKNLQPSANLVSSNSSGAWSGQAATCKAVLVYRSDSSGKIVIEQMSPPVIFDVAAR